MAKANIAAWAGILSGVGLAMETGLFMASGWSATSFSTLNGAVEVGTAGGHLLRWAVVFGVFNLALLMLFLNGLSEHLDDGSRALGDFILYAGLVGIAIHAIVPIGLYNAVPALPSLADHPVGDAIWMSWKFTLDVAQGTGLFFMGLSMLAAGIGWLSVRQRSVFLAAVALLAGGSGVAAALGTATLLDPMRGLVGAAGLLLSILFRVLGGLHLLRARARAVPPACDRLKQRHVAQILQGQLSNCRGSFRQTPAIR